MDSRRAVAVSVPANLLLVGEYAVTEEGGLGIALAPDFRAHATMNTTDSGPEPHSFGVTGVFPGNEAVWPGDSGFLGGVCEYLHEEIGPLEGDVTIDTTEFFTSDGRKRGFGSSAAMAASLTALWLAGTGSEPTTNERAADRPAADDVVITAIAAHRAAQGGRGSGYDVATSAIGGVVLFTGGAKPRARRVELPWLPAVKVFAGHAAVATSGAVGRYTRWKARDPGEAERFLARSNEIVEQLVSVGAWDEARPLLAEYRALTETLGTAIGVSARIDPPQRISPPAFWKAVGAGNELGVILGAAGAGDSVPIAREGLRWR